jgi:hypothetical protein
LLSIPMHLPLINFSANFGIIFKKMEVPYTKSNKLTLISLFFGKLIKKFLISLPPSSMAITSIYSLPRKQFNKLNNVIVLTFHSSLNSPIRTQTNLKMRNCRKYLNF